VHTTLLFSPLPECSVKYTRKSDVRRIQKITCRTGILRQIVLFFYINRRTCQESGRMSLKNTSIKNRSQMPMSFRARARPQQNCISQLQFCQQLSKTLCNPSISLVFCAICTYLHLRICMLVIEYDIKREYDFSMH